MDESYGAWIVAPERCGRASGPENGLNPLAEITAGSRWQKTMLGTTATYEVVDVEEDLVLVKVLTAPGLPAGARVWLAKTSFSAMQRLSDDSMG
jgi:hypothetical protein